MSYSDDSFQDGRIPTNSVVLTRNNKVNVLRRAREILSDRSNWIQSRLRERRAAVGDQEKYGYCLLGACEQAAYDLGLATPDDAFRGNKSDSFDAYLFGRELGLADFALQQFGETAYRVNDNKGYEATIELLDRYIEVSKGG